MTEAITPETVTGEPVEPSEDLPAEKDPYFTRPRDASGKFLPKTDAAPDGAEPAKEEPEPAAAKPEAKPEPPKDEERAPVAREATSLKKQRKWISEQRAELERLRATVEADRRETDRLRALRRENPRAVLDELGLSFRELAEEATRQEGEDPRDKAMREMRAELEELKGFKTTLAKERETQAQQQAYSTDVSAVAERVKTDAEAYPFLAAYGEERAARAAVNTWYQQRDSGETPDLYDILDSLEGELRSDYERLHTAQSKRTQPASSLAAQAAGAPGRGNGAEKSAKHVADKNGTPPPATLTNRIAAERASPDRALSREERRKAAAARIVIRD